MTLYDKTIWKGRVLVEPSDERLTEGRYRLARIPPKRQAATWDYYPAGAPYKKQLLAYVAQLNERRLDGQGLMLVGPTRRGKTSAAALLCKEIIRRDGFPLFVQARKLPAIQLGKMGEDLPETMRHTAFLIVDDLGDMTARGFSCDVFEDLLRDREERALATIITSNLDLDELTAVYGAPCIALLQEICDPVLFS